MHRYVSALALLLTALMTGDSAAAPPEFPYESQVVVEGAEARAGSGPEFTVTSRLPAGTPVTVVRHDPGGWVMIQPPPGSFSYIRPNHVRVIGDGQGVVELPGGGSSAAAVRIGSTVSDDAFSVGRTLPSGHRVSILGRAVVNTGGGRSQEMLRIAPPPREYRWIRGDALASPTQDALFAADPAADATQPITMTPGQAPSIVGGEAGPEMPFGSPAESELEQQVESTIRSGAARRTGSTPQQARAEHKKLAETDRRFREMVQADPGRWDLDSLEASYRSIHDATASDTMRSMVAKRLAALQRRREVYRQYRDFVDLTTRTSQRERALLNQQQASQSRLQELQAPIDLGASAGGPVIETAPPSASSMQTTGSTYSGAGVIVPQRTGLGLTRYLLVSPGGKTLAIVQPLAGVDMRPHVNQPRGLVGERAYDPAAGLDVISAERLDPVKLSQN